LLGTGSRLTDRIRAGVRWGAQRAHAEPRSTRRNSNCGVGGSAPELAPGVLFLHGGPIGLDESPVASGAAAAVLNVLRGSA